MTHRNVFACFLPILIAGCDLAKQPPTSPTSNLRTHDPMIVTATWSGGRTGSATNSSANPPARYFGLLCPANSLELLNFSPPFNGLTIRNTCTAQVTYAFCVSAGSGSSGGLEGVPTCASELLTTRAQNLSFLTLPPSGVTYINSARSLTVVFLWCSDQAVIAPAGTAGSRLTCTG